MVDIVGRAKMVVFAELDPSTFRKAGAEGGSTLSAAFGGVLKTGAKTAGLAAAAAVGQALVGGFKRLNTLEQAQVAFKGITGSAKQTAQIMAAVDRAVTGTAVSLDEGATAAKGFVAAGVKTKQLQEILGNIADAAALTGQSFTDLSTPVLQVINKQKVLSEELQQLAERGVPIFQALAQQTGMSVAEVTQAVTDGKISVDDFTASLNRLPNIAQEANNTVSGSFANMRTAFSRFGATLLGPVFTALPTVFNGIAGAVNRLQTKFKNLSDGTNTEFTQKLQPTIARFKAAWETAEPSVRKVLDKLGELVTRITVRLLPVLRDLANFILGRFATALKNSPPFLDALAKGLGAVAKAADLAFDALDKLKGVMDWLNKHSGGAAGKALLGLSTGGAGFAFGATGITNSPGGWTVVGEQGPELVNLPRGSDVFPHHESQRMLTAGGGTVNQTIVFNGPTSLSAGQKQAEWWRRYGTRFGDANTAVGV